MTREQRLEEYLRRNLLVAKCEGAISIAQKIADRVNSYSRIPIWLAQDLAQVRIETLPKELAAHRDEYSPYTGRKGAKHG